MKKRCFLPMEEPQFISYYHHTYINAIIKANARHDAQTLFCSRYINCFFKENATKNKLVISLYDTPFRQGRLHEQMLNLLKDTYRNNRMDLLLILKKILLSDCYVLACCNCSCMEAIPSHKAPDRDVVIAGFDDFKRAFTVYALNTERRFQCYQIGYELLIDSLYQTLNPKIVLFFWQYDSNLPVTVDFPTLVLELEEYLQSKNNRDPRPINIIYGLDAIVAFANYLFNTSKKGLKVDEEVLHLFSVHKYYMRERVTYLVNQGMLNTKWLLHAERVEELAKNAVALAKQYNFSNGQPLPQAFLDNMMETVTIEREYLPCVLEEIKKSCRNNFSKM